MTRADLQRLCANPDPVMAVYARVLTVLTTIASGSVTVFVLSDADRGADKHSVEPLPDLIFEALNDRLGIVYDGDGPGTPTLRDPVSGQTRPAFAGELDEVTGMEYALVRWSSDLRRREVWLPESARLTTSHLSWTIPDHVWGPVSGKPWPFRPLTFWVEDGWAADPMAVTFGEGADANKRTPRWRKESR